MVPREDRTPPPPLSSACRAGVRLLGVLLFASLVIVAAAWPRQEEPGVPRVVDVGLSQLARNRVDAAQNVYEALQAEPDRTGLPAVEDLHRWSVAWMEAQRDLGTAPDRDAYKGHLSRMQALESSLPQGAGDAPEGKAARYFVIEAKYWLKRAEAGIEVPR